MSPVFIIAEAGVNHNGSYDTALRLVDAAFEAGADAVKFQTFKAENLVTKSAPKAKYQEQTTNENESQLPMLKRLELSHDSHRKLQDYCNNRGIKFLSTAFDLESLSFLVKDLGLRTLKIPSGEITNGPLLLAHAESRCDLIVSTGMATMAEIREALGVIAFGLNGGKNPSRKKFESSFDSIEGREALENKVTLLHCTSEYPAPLEDINLECMQSMNNVFGLRTGYSDHSEGVVIPIAAAAMGATVIEKHFTLDRSLPGPDHKASLLPGELRRMVDGIRAVELAMGDGKKTPTASESGNREIVRKSLIASVNIKKGELFSVENICVKRPGKGRSPMEYWEKLGKFANTDIAADEYIE